MSSNPLMTTAQSAADNLKKSLSTQVNDKLSDATDKLEKRLNSLANTKLAETFLTTGAKDELLTVDPLGVSDINILNSLAGKLSGFDTGFLESFRSGGSTILGEVSSLFGSGSGGFSFDAAALTNRVVESLGGSQGMLRNLSSELTTNLTQGVNIDSSIYDQVLGSINGTLSTFTTNSFGDARGIFDLVNQITGQSNLAQFFDVGAEANLLSGIFNEAIQLGVPMAIEALLDAADSSYAADQALRANIPTVIAYSDLSTATTLIDRLGVNQVIADAPAMAQELLSTYKMPQGTTSAQYATRYSELKSVLDTIQPGWGHVDRNGTSIVDLGMFANASPDAIIILGTQVEWSAALKIAGLYTPARNLVEVGRKMYPLAVI